MRTIKGNVPSAQWDRELFLTLASTPWDPKGKNTEDTSFVLPPTLTVTGRMRPPPGLTAPGGSEDTQDVLPEHQGMETEAFENFLDTGSDLRLPETSRSEPTKRTATDLDELPEELRREHKSQAIGFVGVCATTVGDTDVPVETNVDHQGLRDEMRLTEPQLFKTETEFEEYLVPAMKKEMGSMKKFDVYYVYDEVPLSECTPDKINGALPTKWVKTRKTADTVRARVVVMGCFQEQIDPDVVYASTPTLATIADGNSQKLDNQTAGCEYRLFTCSYARHCFDRTAERILPKPRLSLETKKGYVWTETITCLVAVTLSKCYG